MEGEVDRGEESVGIVEVGQRAALIVSGVADEFHAVALVAQAGIDTQGSPGQVGRGVSTGCEPGIRVRAT